MALIEVNGETVYCLKCKSEDIAKNGHDRYGKQCYWCSKCKYSFIAHFDRSKPYHSACLTDAQKKEKKHQYYLDHKGKFQESKKRHLAKLKKTLEREKALYGLRLLFGKSKSVDSIIDVPCFVCYQYDCEPISCKKLTEWLEREIT